MSGLNLVDYQKRRALARINAFMYNDDQVLDIGGQGEYLSGRFLKQTHKLPGGERLYYVESNTSRPPELIWKTTQKRITVAIQYGLYKPVSLVGRVMYQCGQYNKSKVKRLVKHAVMDKNHEIKRKLMEWTQGRLDLYQNHIDPYINAYNETETLQENKVRLIQSLDQHMSDLTVLVESLDSYEGQDRYSLSKDHRILVKYKVSITDEIRDLHLFKTNAGLLGESNFRSMLKWTGLRSIGMLLRKQLYRILITAQMLNQNLTTMRGDFNSAIEDALYELRHDNPDHHNPITPAQRGEFSQNRDEVVYVNARSVVGDSASDLANFAMMAYAVSGGFPLNFQLGTFKNKGVARSRFPKWVGFRRNEALGDYRLGYLATAIESAVNLLFSPIDFFGALYRGRAVKYFSVLRRPLTNALFGCCCIPCLDCYPQFHQMDCYATLEAKILSNAIPFAARIGVLAREVIRGLALSSFKGFWSGFEDALGHLVAICGNDARHGHYYNFSATHRASLNVVREVFNPIVQATNARNYKLTTNPAIRYKEQPKDPREASLVHSEQPSPASYGATAPAAPDVKPLLAEAFPQMGYHSTGLLNTMTNGLKSFVDLFEHHIFAKHPFAGLLFTVAYTAGAMAVMNPKLAKSLLGGQYVEFSQNLGNFAAHGNASSAIASGFIQAKVVACTFELMLHGADSWMVKGARIFKNDPGVFIAYTSLAIGFGYLLAYKANIPWLSKHLKDDIGSFAPLALGFAGLKVGVVLLEAFIVETESGFELNPEVDFERVLFDVVNKIKQASPEPGSLTPQEEAELKTLARSMLSTARTSVGGLAKAKTSEAFKTQMQRIRILSSLAENAKVLPLLPSVHKRDVCELVDRYFPVHTARSLKSMVYPKPHRSMMGAFFYNLITYPFLILRTILSPFSGSWRPLFDLKERVLDDLTSTVTAFATVASILSDIFLDRIWRVLFDLIFNALFSRLEVGFCKVMGSKPSHYASNMTYSASLVWSHLREWVMQAAYWPVFKLQARQMVKRPDLALTEAMMVYTHASIREFAHAQENITPFEEQQDYQRRQSGQPKIKRLSDGARKIVGAPSTVIMNPATAAVLFRAKVIDDEVKPAGSRRQRASSILERGGYNHESKASRSRVEEMMMNLRDIQITARPFFKPSQMLSTSCFNHCCRNHEPDNGCMVRSCYSLTTTVEDGAALFRCVKDEAIHREKSLSGMFVGV